MTGQFVLLATIFAHDLDWVRWFVNAEGQICTGIKIGKAAMHLRSNWTRVHKYIEWWENHGYVSVITQKKGEVQLRWLKISSRLVKAVLATTSSKRAGRVPPSPVSSPRSKKRKG